MVSKFIKCWGRLLEEIQYLFFWSLLLAFYTCFHRAAITFYAENELHIRVILKHHLQLN